MTSGRGRGCQGSCINHCLPDLSLLSPVIVVFCACSCWIGLASISQTVLLLLMAVAPCVQHETVPIGMSLQACACSHSAASDVSSGLSCVYTAFEAGLGQSRCAYELATSAVCGLWALHQAAALPDHRILRSVFQARQIR